MIESKVRGVARASHVKENVHEEACSQLGGKNLIFGK